MDAPDRIFTKYPFKFENQSYKRKKNLAIPTWRSDVQHTVTVQLENTGRVEPGVVWVRLGEQHLGCNLVRKLR